MLVHSFSAMVSCFPFLSEGVWCVLGVAIVVGGGGGGRGFAPSFPERAFFPFLHFYKFRGLPPPFSFFPPPPLFFLSASSERQKALLGPYRFDFFPLPPANGIFSAFSFPFFGIVALSLKSSSRVEAMPFSPDIPVGSSARLREAGRTVPKRPGAFRCLSPVGCPALPPPRMPGEFLRFPGSRAAAAPSAPKSPAGERGARPGTGSALPVGGGRWRCLRPETFVKVAGGTERFVLSLFRRLLVTKWQWAWVFQGFLGVRYR